MPFSLPKLPTPIGIPKILREHASSLGKVEVAVLLKRFHEIQINAIGQLEQEMETVINVLQPGPLGIIEHKFSAAEVQKAKATVKRAVDNWCRNAALEKTAMSGALSENGGSQH